MIIIGLVCTLSCIQLPLNLSADMHAAQSLTECRRLAPSIIERWNADNPYARVLKWKCVPTPPTEMPVG